MQIYRGNPVLSADGYAKMRTQKRVPAEIAQKLWDGYVEHLLKEASLERQLRDSENEKERAQKNADGRAVVVSRFLQIGHHARRVCDRLTALIEQAATGAEREEPVPVVLGRALETLACVVGILGHLNEPHNLELTYEERSDGPGIWKEFG